jgi:hypothetical protein
MAEVREGRNRRERRILSQPGPCHSTHACSRSITAWRPNTAFRRRSMMQWRQRSGHDPRCRLAARRSRRRLGESAGGNLAASPVRACGRTRALHPLSVLLQPVVDFTLSFPSIAMPSTECLVPREDLAWYYRTYRSDQCDPRIRASRQFTPRISPSAAGADHRRRIRHVAR